MRALRTDNEGVWLSLESLEEKIVNNVLAWLLYGTHGVEGREFEQHVGATEKEVKDLLRRLGAAESSEGRAILRLQPAEVMVLNRAFEQMLDGPAELSGASRGTPDWVLLGVTEQEFDAARAEVRAITASVLP